MKVDISLKMIKEVILKLLETFSEMTALGMKAKLWSVQAPVGLALAFYQCEWLGPGSPWVPPPGPRPPPCRSTDRREAYEFV